MKITEHLDALRREGALLAEAAAATDLSAPVPTCPDWRLADLLRHTGQVHLWAASYPARGFQERLDDAGEREVFGPDPSDAALLDWYRESHAALVDTLATAPADTECWTFLPAPSPLAFWARRQAHETAVHRIDADAAAGRPGPEVEAALALDGVDELLRGFMRRDRSQLHSDEPRTLLIQDADGLASWHVTVNPGPLEVVSGEEAPAGPAELTITGPAHDLYLLLWNRLPAGVPARVRLDGDESLLDLWRAKAQVG
ncbi:maleylpyruvate isomerase family mycothiol-dependent enzyme [Streptomyces sp. NRRL WC-3742]|uniref:maleylpyruvate isomerase family mycothiol-dependent enzyme n=1 Tax=Streptomyces sp. NRRL WC-3742 TaxID=1463934 RepID=UPI0004C63EC7|nr:maleylpyruvate isomerase family mycothiol-dependent enzyme [Streptomyces sp. NRRL WC-3742]